MHERTVTTRAVALAFVACAAAFPSTLEAGEESAQKLRLVPRGEYVRQVSNDEATIVVGYRTANQSVGKEWMLLEVAFTVFRGHNQTVTREQFTLETPDGTVIPMATQAEAQAETATLKALNRRADVQREPINYLPKQAQVATPMAFFADPSEPGVLPFDQFGASPEQGRVGRLFFKVPGGIEYGRYFLNVELEESELSVPVNIMTKEQLKEAKKKYREYVAEQKKIAKEEKREQK